MSDVPSSQQGSLIMQHAKHDANLLLICLQRLHAACHRPLQLLSSQHPQGKIPSHPALET